MRIVRIVLSITILLSAAAWAQSDAQKPSDKTASNDNPYSAFTRMAYGHVKSDLVRSAEKVPEADYSFRPTPEVRSFGQIIGHVADAQYLFCSTAMGEKNPQPNIEKTKTSKADLITALKESSAYCDKAYDSMTDASGAQIVDLFGHQIPKLGALIANNMHGMEHYGNLITYMRMKNIVPPSSEAQPKK